MSSSSADGSDSEENVHDSDFADDDLDDSDDDSIDRPTDYNSIDGPNGDVLNESDNSYDDDINSIEHDYEVGDKRSRTKIGEAEKTSMCLSDDAITQLIIKCECSKARLSGSCPNQCKCSDAMTQQFGLIKTKDILRKFREKFWTYNEVNKTLCIRNRRITILRELSTMFLVGNDGIGTIDYKVGGYRVCKTFYFQATGISKRMFNDGVSYILGTRTTNDLQNFLTKNKGKESIPIPKKLKSHLSDSSAEHVVKFLTHYFTYSVEWSPHERDVRYIHMTFKYLYKKFYEPYCERKHIIPVTLQQFYRIRKHYCPNYKKSKTIRPGGWNHVRCDTCDSLQRDIMQCEEGSEECRQKQKEFLSHMTKQDCCR
jgi:hypothetical protein